MRKKSFLLSNGVWALVFVVASSASAININLQYPAGNLFSDTHNLTARAAINAAAADISAAITSSLNAINTDVFVGNNGGTTATFDWSYQYSNPSTGGSTTIPVATIPANTVTVYVGTRNLPGSTLGFGGPSGAGFSVNVSGFPNQLVGAVANGEAASEAAYTRGGGPVIGTLANSITLGATTAYYSIDFGIAYGSLALDWNGSGDGNWHFNHTTPVAAGKNDLYSVALHEMLHALGIGASDSWDNLVSGTNWLGPEVTSLHGSGAGLITGSHIKSGVMSTRISDGMPQEVVMDPDILQGTRKSLTALDLAFLRDIGYSTIIPATPTFSPADFNHNGYVDGTDLLTWRNWYGVNANGDADGDGDTDGRDFLIWQREYTGPGPLSANVAVPEPGTAALVASALLCLVGLRRRS